MRTPKPRKGINVRSQRGGGRMWRGLGWWVRHLDKRPLYSSAVKSRLPGREPLSGDAGLDSPSLLTPLPDNSMNKSKFIHAEWTSKSRGWQNQIRVIRYILKGVSFDSDFVAGIPGLLCFCWCIGSNSQQQVIASLLPYCAFESSSTAPRAWINFEPTRKDSSKGSKQDC